MNILIWLVIGGVIGWLASLMMRTDGQQGILLNVVVGIIGALLGHTQPGTTARYAHLFDDPLRAAAERVGAIVTGAGTSHTEALGSLTPAPPRRFGKM